MVNIVCDMCEKLIDNKEHFVKVDCCEMDLCNECHDKLLGFMINNSKNIKAVHEFFYDF